MPVLLYDRYTYDPKDPDEGLFQSAFLVCVLVDILFGPQAVDTREAKRTEQSRHHCVVGMYNIVTITPQMIAYAAIAARFALSSKCTWNMKDDQFDYRTYYRAVIMRLSDPTDPWVDRTLAWWNYQVFGDERGKVLYNSDEESDKEWHAFIRRRAA